MKRIVATLIGLTLATLAGTASAYVVEVTTSIPAVKAADDQDLKEALAAAIDDAVKNAVAFRPTLVTVQNARLVGDRIYVQLLIVDQDGEEVIKQLGLDGATPDVAPGATPEPTKL